MKKITNLLIVACFAFFSWHGIAQSGGDDCASAVAVTPGNFTGTTITDGTGGASGTTAGSNDATWFSYTPTEDGTIDISSCDGGVDTTLNVFDICGGTAIAQATDVCTLNGPGTNSWAAELTDVAVTAGTTYFIEWNDRWSEDPFDWSLTFIPPPACPDITGITSTINVDTSVSLDWDDATGVVGYNYEVQPIGVAQGTAGALVDDSSITSDAVIAAGDLTDGDSYTIYVQTDCGGGLLGNFESTTLNYNLPPANDTCAGVIDLDNETSPLSGSTAGASNDFVGDCLTNAGAPDLFYSITVPDTFTLELQQLSNGYDSEVRLAYGATCPGDQLIACQDDPDTGLLTWTNETGSSQEVYYIQSAFSTGSGVFELEWSVSAPPACADVTGITSTINVDTSVSLDWDDATGVVGYNYEVQPLGVAQGTAGALVNDSSTTSDAVINAGVLTDGESYTIYVQTDCGGGLLGNFESTTLDYILPPANDTCAGVIDLDNETSPLSATTVGANNDFVGDCLTNAGAPDLFYSITVPVNFTLNLEQLSNNYDSEVRLAYGATCPGDQLIACQDDPDTGLLTWTNDTGSIQEVYYIQSAFSTGSGDFELQWSLIAPPACIAPSDLSFTTTSATEATISWTDTNTPAAESGYEYELINVTQGETFDDVVEGTSPSGTLSAALSTLTNGEDYSFRVRALCGGGLGGATPSDWSDAIDWTQILAPGCASNPSPVDGDTTTPIGAVTFTWDAPTTGGTATEYDVYAGDTAALEFGVIATVTTNSADLSVNAPETTLFWQIVPKNAGGEASGCPIWSFTTVAADPSGVDCANAEPVSDGTYTVFLENNNPGGGGGTPDDSIWFVYTATNFGTLDINSCGNGVDTDFDVFDECEGVVLASGTDDCGLNPDGSGNQWASQAIIDVVPGEDYYIAWNDTWSSGVFEWDIVFTGECADSTTWDGTAWSNGDPDATKTAIINGAYSTTTANIDACAVYITALGTLTVEGDTYVSSNGTIVNDGVMTVNHTGSVVQVDDTADMTNNGILEVTIDSPTGDLRDFIISGSPLDGETREDVWGASYNVQGYAPANFVPNTDVGNSGVAYNFSDDNLDDWNPHTGALTPGAGYLVFPQDAYGDAGVNIPSFTHSQGNLNNGVITQPLNFNTTQLDSPNMLSNPYASAIDTDLFLAANPEIDAVYFWEHGAPPSTSVPGVNVANYTMEDISVYNGTGGMAASGAGTTPTNVMASSQGFGVFASAAGTATFNNGMRLTSGNTTLRAPEVANNRIWLQVANTEFETRGNTLIGFLENGTQGFDKGFDNQRIGTITSLYSHFDASSEEGYSIQAREVFDADMQISLGFATLIEAETSYTISIDDVDGIVWDNVDAYLIDHATNNKVNLSETDYVFTSNAGEFNNRFTLEFVDRSVLGTTEGILNSISIAPNPAQDYVIISSPVAEVTGVTITDIQGRVIESMNVEGLNTYQLDMSKLGSAVYFITVNTPSGDITKRVIKR